MTTLNTKKDEVPEIHFGVALGSIIDNYDNNAVGYAGNERSN
jgi:hypothetical protein